VGSVLFVSLSGDDVVYQDAGVFTAPNRPAISAAPGGPAPGKPLPGVGQRMAFRTV
jgi:hypothetical protein